MHETQVKVRFCETDALGHINNTSYFIYFEEARLAFMEELEFEVESKNQNIVLASTKCDFINQGFFHQELTVRTYVSRIGVKSFSLDHEIICSRTKQLVAKGSDVVVHFNFDRQESEAIPESLREKLKGVFVGI